AADTLFRSAAVEFDGRVVGIVLSGMLYDGAAGLEAVKRCGGIAMVQNPETALYPDMPLNALNRIKVDYCVNVAQMPGLLVELSKKPVEEKTTIPKDLIMEAKIAERMISGIENMDELGERSPYSCPE